MGVSQLICVHFIMLATFLGQDEQLPEKHRATLNRSIKRYSEDCDAAKQRLSDAFKDQSVKIAKDRNLDAVAKERMQDWLNAEQKAFTKNGRIPWSPQMRLHAIAYLGALKESRLRSEKDFENVYRQLQKNNPDLAKAVAEEKEKSLGPKVVGKWKYNFRSTFIYTLRSDGTAYCSSYPDRDYCSWSIDSTNKLTIINKMPGSPPAGWIDKGHIEPDGQLFVAKNQNGVKFVGAIIE